MLIRAHEAVMKKWAEIAWRLPRWSDNSINNHWNATMQKLDSKKNNKKSNFKGSPLQNYIRSIIALQTNKNKNNHILNNVAVENRESSSQALNEVVSVDHDDHADPQKQLLPRNSEMILVNNSIINPMANLVFNNNDHEKKYYQSGSGKR